MVTLRAFEPWAHLLMVLILTVPFGIGACRLALARHRSGTRAGAPTKVDAPAKPAD